MGREDIKLRIRDILAQKGMDCASLAEKMGKSPQYVNNVLNKRKDMSLNALIGIADALGVEFGDLFVSSFTPDSPMQNDFVAVVKCRRGVFTAESADELQNIVDTISDRNTNIIALTKRTLERLLRFPQKHSFSYASELIANLSRCMNPDDWYDYYHGTIKGLLPANFALDMHHLSKFMTPDEMLAVERSLL